MLIEGYLHGAAQIQVANRLENVTQRLGHRRAAYRVCVGVRRQVDHGDLELVLERLRRGDAIHLALKADVHQHQVESNVSRESQRFFTRARDRRHGVAQPLQATLNVVGDQAFILDYQDLLSRFLGCLHLPIPLLTR